jgi:hypothetical protein
MRRMSRQRLGHGDRSAPDRDDPGREAIRPLRAQLPDGGVFRADALVLPCALFELIGLIERKVDYDAGSR